MPLDPEHTISAVNYIPRLYRSVKTCNQTLSETDAQASDLVMQQPNLSSAVMLQQPLRKVISCFVTKAHHVYKCAGLCQLLMIHQIRHVLQ